MLKNLMPALFVAALWAGEARGTTTDVENVADPTKHPYMQETSATCTLGGDCALLFPAITTARALVQHASCSFTQPASTQPAWAKLEIEGSLETNSLPMTSGGPVSGVTTWGINADTYLFYAHGQSPVLRVYMQGTGSSTLDCTISGYYL